MWQRDKTMVIAVFPHDIYISPLFGYSIWEQKKGTESKHFWGNYELISLRKALKSTKTISFFLSFLKPQGP